METYDAWASGRPIFQRLPEVYQESLVTDWLTQYFDDLLVGSKALIDDIPRQINPLTCDEYWLDLLAPLFGFSGKYWDRAWTVEAKRLLLSNSYTLIWKRRGTKESLAFVLTALGIQHEIWVGSSFVLGKSKVSVDALGLGAWKYKILLPRRYVFNGYEFKLVKNINKLFGNLWCDSEVTYRDLVLGSDFPSTITISNQMDFSSSDNSSYILLGL